MMKMYNNKTCDMNVWALLLGALLLFVYFTNNLCRTRTEFFENERGNVIEDAWAQLRERAETMYGRDGDEGMVTKATSSASASSSSPSKEVRFEEIPSLESSAKGGSSSPSLSPSVARPTAATATAPSAYARYLPYAAWTVQGDMRQEWDRPQECATPAPAAAPPTESPSVMTAAHTATASAVPFPAGQMAAAMARMRAPTLAPSPIVMPTTPSSPMTMMRNPSTAAPSFVVDYPGEDDEGEEEEI